MNLNSSQLITTKMYRNLHVSTPWVQPTQTNWSIECAQWFLRYIDCLILSEKPSDLELH